MKRRALIATGSVVVGAGGFAGVRALLVRPRPTDAPDRPITTATVARQNLVEVRTVPGKLGYGPELPVECRLEGTVTQLPPTGSIVDVGKALFRINDSPVVLLAGPIPSYRALAVGIKGADVKQLETNLRALGYSGLSVDDQFTAQTEAAVKRWQRDLGLEQTGTVELGRVVYTAGPVRVARHKIVAGAVAAGPVLTVTGTARMITAQLAAADQELAKPGTKVTASLGSGKEAAGTVQSVHAVEDSPGQEPVWQAVIALDTQASVNGTDDGNVSVRFQVQERKDILTVPVGALVALAEGGFGLQLLDGGQARYVAVTTGLFANGKVEVSGPDIREGLTIGMAQ